MPRQHQVFSKYFRSLAAIRHECCYFLANAREPTTREDAALFNLFKNKHKSGIQAGVSLEAEGVVLAAMATDGRRLAVLDAVNCAPQEQGAALESLVDRHDLSGAECVVVLDPDQYHLLQVEAPDVEADELRAAIRWRIKDLIDFHVDDAVIDVFELPGQNQPGRARMMYAVAARQAVVEATIEKVNDAGLQLTAIDIAEMALRNIMALCPEDPTGAALLHMGKHGGQIVITRGGQLCLSRHLDLSLDAAPARAVAGEAQAPVLEMDALQLDHVVLEIQRSLDYYESFFGFPPVAGVLIAPLPWSIPSLLSHASQTLAVPVRSLDLAALLEHEGEPLDEATQAGGLLAVGGALRREQRSL